MNYLVYLKLKEYLKNKEVWIAVIERYLKHINKELKIEIDMILPLTKRDWVLKYKNMRMVNLETKTKVETINELESTKQVLCEHSRKRLIKKIVEDGITLIIVSHEDEFIKKVSDRIYYLNDNKLEIV